MNEQNTDPQQCSQDGCFGDWFGACEHGDFCVNHLGQHVRTDPVCYDRWVRCIADIDRLLANFETLTDEHFPLRCALPIALVQARDVFTRMLRGAYEAAGAPFGVGDSALWRWIAEAELSQTPETWRQ